MCTVLETCFFVVENKDNKENIKEQELFTENTKTKMVLFSLISKTVFKEGPESHILFFFFFFQQMDMVFENILVEVLLSLFIIVIFNIYFIKFEISVEMILHILGYEETNLENPSQLPLNSIIEVLNCYFGVVGAISFVFSDFEVLVWGLQNITTAFLFDILICFGFILFLYLCAVNQNESSPRTTPTFLPFW